MLGAHGHCGEHHTRALSEGFVWEASRGQSPPDWQVDLVPGAALSLPVQLGRH